MKTNRLLAIAAVWTAFAPAALFVLAAGMVRLSPAATLALLSLLGLAALVATLYAAALPDTSPARSAFATQTVELRRLS